jgi:hypothetical protein
VGGHRLRALYDLHAAEHALAHVMHVRHRVRLWRQGTRHVTH